MSTCCRVCLQYVEEVEILDLSLICDEEAALTYSECFTVCTKIVLNINDGLPYNLCKSCGVELQMAYDFHKKVDESKKVLSQMLRPPIKIEASTSAAAASALLAASSFTVTEAAAATTETEKQQQQKMFEGNELNLMDQYADEDNMAMADDDMPMESYRESEEEDKKEFPCFNERLDWDEFTQESTSQHTQLEPSAMPYVRPEATGTNNDKPFEIATADEYRKLDEVQLAFHAQHKSGKLENRERIAIAKSFIVHTLKDNKSRSLNRYDFDNLARCIVELFPTEVKETYYIPSKQGHRAKGKLVDSYNNYRSRLSAAGVISRRAKIMKNKPPAYINFIDQKEPNIAGAIEILQTGSAEWQTILTKWHTTHWYRQKELQCGNLTPLEYFNKYLVLQNERSYELLLMDYKLLYPQTKSIAQWQPLYIKIMKSLEKAREPFVRDLIKNIYFTTNEDIKQALAFMLIPYILHNSRRLNRSEVQRCFIRYYRNIREADDDIARCKLENEKQSKTPCEPSVHLIGYCHKAMTLSYIDIAGKRVKFENPLKAIEACFYCYLTMNMHYPKNCEHIWFFIQKAVFQITTNWEITIPSVDTLINDLRSVE